MISLESAAWILIRTLLGVFISTALSIVVWVLSQLFLRDLALATTSFFITQSLVIGIPAGVGAVAAWWNPDTAGRLRFIYAAIIPIATALCAWLVVEIRGVQTYYALFGGSYRISVIVQGDLLGTLIVSSVLGGNIIAASFYIYRLIRHRET